MQDPLKQFMERLSIIVRDRFQTYGRDTNFPNVTTTQKELGDKLQRAAITFAQAYVDPKHQQAEVSDGAKQVEGFIRTGQTIGTLNDKEAASLLDELYTLVEERK